MFAHHHFASSLSPPINTLSHQHIRPPTRRLTGTSTHQHVASPTHLPTNMPHQHIRPPTRCLTDTSTHVGSPTHLPTNTSFAPTSPYEFESLFVASFNFLLLNKRKRTVLFSGKHKCSIFLFVQYVTLQLFFSSSLPGAGLHQH